MAQNYVLLERIELNASAASVTFSNIPQTGYTDLKLVWSARGTGSLVYDTTKITFNGNASSYSTRYIQGSGSAASSGTSGASTYLEIIDEGGNATASTFGNSEIYIPNYAGSANKSVSSDAVTETNATTVYMRMSAGLWSNTAAITSVTLTPDASAAYASGSTFSLYGIAAVGTTPAVAPKADGGNVIATDGTYWYHAFLSNGTFTPQINLTSCDVLVVAGGGGSGNGTNVGAGGGAGGLLYATAKSFTGSTAYTAVVGAGGSPDAAGSDSTITDMTGFGGGRGGNESHIGGNGGSGGGSTWAPGLNTPGTATQTSNGGGTGYGNAGGSNTVGSGSNHYPSGGGGGAGAVGGNGTSALQGGNGGVGLSGTTIAALDAFGAATATGQLVSGHYYYAGGGGGGSWIGSSTYSSGGYGGGGRGGANISGGDNPADGTPNTGGGGGGNGSSGVSGRSGGSGIIIIRYPVAS